MIYGGLKNYFNRTTGVCQSIVICGSNENYNYLTNSCTSLTPDFTSYPNTTSNTSTEDISNNLIIPQIICENGYTSMCICYTGWESDNTSTSNTTNSTILTINKCNKIIDGFLNNTITNNQNVNNTAVTEDSSGNSTQNNFLDNTNSSTLHITTTSTTSSFNWNSFLMYFGIASFVIITCSCCFCFIFKKIKNNMDDNQDISHTTKEANLRNIYSQPIYFIPGEKNDNQRPYNIEVLNDVYNLEKRKSTFHTPTKSKIENEDIYIDKRTYYPKSENKIVYLSNPPS